MCVCVSFIFLIFYNKSLVLLIEIRINNCIVKKNFFRADDSQGWQRTDKQFHRRQYKQISAPDNCLTHVPLAISLLIIGTNLFNFISIFIQSISLKTYQYISSWFFSEMDYLVGWVLWHINLSRLFNAKSIFIQIIYSISNNSVYHEYTVRLSKIVLF